MARAALRGRKRFALKLRNLKPAVRYEIEGATEKNAREMAIMARGYAPQSQGGGDLKASTKAERYTDGPAIRWRVVSGDAVAFYARFVEFGTAAAEGHGATPAQPYFFVSYRALRRRMKRRLGAAFGRAKRKVFK